MKRWLGPCHWLCYDKWPFEKNDSKSVVAKSFSSLIQSTLHKNNNAWLWKSQLLNHWCWVSRILVHFLKHTWGQVIKCQSRILESISPLSSIIQGKEITEKASYTTAANGKSFQLACKLMGLVMFVVFCQQTFDEKSAISRHTGGQKSLKWSGNEVANIMRDNLNGAKTKRHFWERERKS